MILYHYIEKNESYMLLNFRNAQNIRILYSKPALE